MPFILPEQRNIVDAIGPQVVGDRCFLAYRDMKRKWAKSRRWTTAHEIYKEVLEAKRDRVLSDDLVALDLAWQVFFVMEVVPYEEEKKEDHGDVE